jgi:hypothetical protein
MTEQRALLWGSRDSTPRVEEGWYNGDKKWNPVPGGITEPPCSWGI